MNKADTFTAASKQKEYFSDFTDSFLFSPVNNELCRVVNEKSVIQSMKNLIYTLNGERFFQPLVGCKIYNSNFEIDDNITALGIKMAVEYTINTYEKRCNLISTVVDFSPDTHSADITITFSLINSSTPSTFTVSLKRIR